MKNQITLFLVLGLSTAITPISGVSDLSGTLLTKYKQASDEKKEENTATQSGWKSWCTKKTVATGVIVIGAIILYLVFTADPNDSLDYEEIARLHENWEINEKLATGANSLQAGQPNKKLYGGL